MEKQKLKAFRETCVELNFTNKFFNKKNIHTNFTYSRKILVKQKLKAFRQARKNTHKNFFLIQEFIGTRTK